MREIHLAPPRREAERFSRKAISLLGQGDEAFYRLKGGALLALHKSSHDNGSTEIDVAIHPKVHTQNEKGGWYYATENVIILLPQAQVVEDVDGYGTQRMRSGMHSAPRITVQSREWIINEVGEPKLWGYSDEKFPQNSIIKTQESPSARSIELDYVAEVFSRSRRNIHKEFDGIVRNFYTEADRFTQQAAADAEVIFEATAESLFAVDSKKDQVDIFGRTPEAANIYNGVVRELFDESVRLFELPSLGKRRKRKNHISGVRFKAKSDERISINRWWKNTDLYTEIEIEDPLASDTDILTNDKYVPRTLYQLDHTNNVLYKDHVQYIFPYYEDAEPEAVYEPKQANFLSLVHITEAKALLAKLSSLQSVHLIGQYPELDTK